ncbi:MAG: tetratricopeptide repeat protein [Flavobacteriales bacterium]|nr:tetratricopeptide repeat protein [Flavobacteriales bacterium]
MRHPLPRHPSFRRHRPLRALVRVSVLAMALAHWGTAQAQPAAASVPQVLALPDDTAKVLKLSDLCFAYRRTDADSALILGNAALRLAQKLQYRRGEAQACNDIAILHIDRSDFTAADSLLRRSLGLRTQLGDSAGMAAVYNKLGIIYQARFMLEEALEEDLKALQIYERTGPPAHEAAILNNIAILRFNLNRLPDALATHRRAAAIRARIGDGAGLAASHGNMANVEVQLGDTAAAIAHYEEAIAYFREQDQKPELAVQLNNLAGIHLARGQLEEAASGYGEALSIRTQAGERKAIASSLIGLGGTRLRQGRFDEARRMLLNALAMSRAVDARSEQMQALLDLARLHAKLDHGDSSFFYHQHYAALKDSVFTADMSARLAQAETKFETAKKERRILAQRAEIAELEQQGEHRRLWLVTAVGGSALVLVTALLLFQVQRRRARAKHDAALITEREAGLRGVIKATETERTRIARELHDGVGQQLTGLKFRLEELEAKADTEHGSGSSAVSEALAIAGDAGREVRDIAHAMMPRALGDQGLGPATSDMLARVLAGAGITHEFDQFGLQDRLPADVEVGVYRIAQELVQNTMKHAQARQVNLQLLRNNGHLVLLYEDDGKGMDLGAGHDGIGLRNIRERVRALRGIFTIGNGEVRGIHATLRIPLDAG